MSLERRRVLAAFGATLVLSQGPKHEGCDQKGHRNLRVGQGTLFSAQQFDNPANPAIHESTTGPEIWNDTDGAMTFCWRRRHRRHITGVSRYIKKTKGKKILSVAVEPVASPVIDARARANRPCRSHRFKESATGSTATEKNFLPFRLFDVTADAGDGAAGADAANKNVNGASVSFQISGPVVDSWIAGWPDCRTAGAENNVPCPTRKFRWPF